MSLEQLEQTLLNLPLEERRRFPNWFYEHEDKLVAAPNEDLIHPEIQIEILRRRDELDAHPELLGVSRRSGVEQESKFHRPQPRSAIFPCVSVVSFRFSYWDNIKWLAPPEFVRC